MRTPEAVTKTWARLGAEDVAAVIFGTPSASTVKFMFGTGPPSSTTTRPVISFVRGTVSSNPDKPLFGTTIDNGDDAIDTGELSDTVYCPGRILGTSNEPSPATGASIEPPWPYSVSRPS